MDRRALRSSITVSAAGWLGKGLVRFLLVMIVAGAIAAFAAGFGIAYDYSYLRASILTGSPGGHYYTLATHLAPFVLLVGVVVSGLTGWREDLALFRPGDAVPVGPAGSFHVRLLEGQVMGYPDGSPSDYRVTLEVVPQEGPAREELLRLNHPVREAGVSLLLAEYVEVGEAVGVRLLAVHDYGYPVVVAGGILLLLGVCLSSYLPHQQVWLWPAADGTTEAAGRTSGDGVGFEWLFRKMVARSGEVAGGEAGSRE